MRRNFDVILNHGRFKLISILFLLIVLLYYNVIVTIVIYIATRQALKSINAMIILVIYILQAATSGIFTHGFIGYVMAIYVRVVKLNLKLGEIVRYPPEHLELIYASNSELCMEMMKFTKIYKQLCSCVDELNRIYGFSLVLHFTHDFTLLTSQIFCMFYVSYYEQWADSKLKILALVLWMILNILKITFICFVCHVTRNEINECSLNLRKFSNEANEDDLSDLVDMFSLQNIHLKTEFTANNFFSIDMSLFYTIISACTTYLVILIQFKNYEDENTAVGVVN
ncbi:hypothetical protein PVAND_003216 [Polypedilum vanderplanki]|nr:hypothetical protein PVAND_003216 [Polypedilum vanderplanki]